MRSAYVAATIAVVALSVPAASGEESGSPPRPAEAAHPTFDALMERARARDADLDFTALRRAWTREDAYNPYVHSSTDYRETIATIETALRQERPAEAAATCEATADRYPIDVAWNVRCDAAHSRSGDPDAALFHGFMVRGLVASILNSGDGRSTATAYRVVTLAEQNVVFSILDVEKQAQSLLSEDGVAYDAIDVDDPETDETRTLYFEIQPFFDWMDRERNAR